MRPFNGLIEFEIGIMLVRWSTRAEELMFFTKRSGDKNIYFEKATTVVEVFLTDFLAYGAS